MSSRTIRAITNSIWKSISFSPKSRIRVGHYGLSVTPKTLRRLRRCALVRCLRSDQTKHQPFPKIMTSSTGLSGGGRCLQHVDDPRNCAECRQLWERYYAATAEEFDLQERMQPAIRLNDTHTARTLGGSAGDALRKTESVHQQMAAHRLWHTKRRLHKNSRRSPKD